MSAATREAARKHLARLTEYDEADLADDIMWRSAVADAAVGVGAALLAVAEEMAREAARTER